jgi:hypothetical protein
LNRTARRVHLRRRWRRVALWSFLLLCLGAGGNVYLATRPERVRALVRAGLEEIFAGEVRFADRVELVWGEGVTVHQLVLTPPPAGEQPGAPVFQVRQAILRPDFTALFFGTLRFSDLLLDAPVLEIARDSSGRWSLAPFRSLLPGDAPAAARARLIQRGRVQAGSIHYRDATASGAPLRQDLLDVEAAFELRDPGRMEFRGTARTPHLSELAFSGSLEADGGLKLDFRASRLDLSAQLARLLDPKAQEFHRRLDLHGFVDLEGSWRFDLEAGLRPAAISGRVRNCHLQPPTFPFPLENVSGEFALEGQRLEFRELRGGVGGGEFQGRALLTLPPDWSGLESIAASATATALPLDNRLRYWLPERLVPQFDRLSCQGRLGLRFEIDSKRAPPRWDEAALEIRIEDVEWLHREFPYPFRSTAGALRVERGAFRFTEPLVASRGDTSLRLAGEGELAPGGRVALDAEIERVPLDDALRNALPASALVKWDLLRPSGELGVRATLRRDRPGAAPEFRAVASLDGVRMRAEHFPYEVEDLSGDLVFDFMEGTVRVERLSGRHGSVELSASGVLETGDEESFQGEVSASELDLDADLRNALPDSFREILEAFRLTGKVGARVEVAVRPQRGLTVDARLRVLGCQAQFTQFPYPLSLRSGEIRVRQDANVVFEGLEFDDGAGLKGSIAGSLERIGAESLLDFRLAVAGLRCDERLQAALPDPLAQLSRGLGFDGELAGDFRGTYSFSARGGGLGRAIYHAQNLRVSSGTIDFGPRLRAVEAAGELVGAKDLEGRHSFEGKVRVASARFNRLRLGSTDLLVAFGKEHAGVERARVADAVEGAIYRPSPKLLARLGPDRIQSTLQVESRPGELYGGRLEGFLYVDVGERRDFAGEYLAEGVEVARCAKDVFGIDDPDLSGHAGGRVAFQGVTGQAPSLSGGGECHVSDARLLRLPLFVGLVSLLFLKPTANPHFNKVDLRFEIREGRFWAPGPDGISIFGDSVNLLGFGSLDFDGGLDVALSPHFLSFRIPILENVLELVKKALIQIRLEGRLESPRVRLATAGGLLKMPLGE